MKFLLAISCGLLPACAATPLHLTYDTVPESHPGPLTVLSATVETVEIETLLVPPDALRLRAECSVRESRELKVTESEAVRVGVSDQSFTHYVLSHASHSNASEVQSSDLSWPAAAAVLAVAIGIPLVAASIDLVSLTITAPVTLTSAVFAGGDRDKSERFDFRYRRQATSATLTDLGTGSSLTLTDQPEEGWLIEWPKLAALGFRSHNLLLEVEGRVQVLTLPVGFLPTARTDEGDR